MNQSNLEENTFRWHKARENDWFSFHFWLDDNVARVFFEHFSDFSEAPSTLHRKEFENRGASYVFRPHYAGRNLKKEVSLWKRIKCLPSTLPQKNLKTEVSIWKRMKCFPSTFSEVNNATLTNRSGFVFKKNSVRKITSWCHHLRKAPFSKYFPFKRTRKASVLKFLWFEERFQKDPLLVRDALAWTVVLTAEIRLRFQISLVYCGRGLTWMSKAICTCFWLALQYWLLWSV